MCERTVTIPLKEYNDLRDKIKVKESSGYYRMSVTYSNYSSRSEMKYYESIPSDIEKELYEADWKISKLNMQIKNMERDLGRARNYHEKIPNWIRKIFNAL